MIRLGIIGLSALLVGQGTPGWARFSSSLYPYSLSQPSSFSHIVITIAGKQQIDYFSPALGSYTTNVNVSAAHGSVLNVAKDLRSRDGINVRSSGVVMILARKLKLFRANFHGLAGSWVEEQVSFGAGGYSWRLTASYDTRYKKLRKTMLKMLQSFRLRPAPKRH